MVSLLTLVQLSKVKVTVSSASSISPGMSLVISLPSALMTTFTASVSSSAVISMVTVDAALFALELEELPELSLELASSSSASVSSAESLASISTVSALSSSAKMSTVKPSVVLLKGRLEMLPLVKMVLPDSSAHALCWAPVQKRVQMPAIIASMAARIAIRDLRSPRTVVFIHSSVPCLTGI